MKKRINRPTKAHLQSGFFTLRASNTVLLCAAAACAMLSGVLLGFSHSEAPVKLSQRTLTFADRVAYQRAIEEVYWRHRIWPKERPDPKPSLDAVMSEAQIEKKVEDYLRDSQVLEDSWQRPITSEQLQAEMERMAQHTKQPEVLRELFEALGNDPFVIAESIARPALAKRLVTNFYAHDQRFHAELRQRAEADLRTHRSVEQMKQIGGNYSEIELVKSESADEENRGAEPGLKLNSREWDENVQKLAAMFGGTQNTSARTGRLSRAVVTGVPPAKGASAMQLKTGVLSPLQEDEGRYYATALLKKSKDRMKLATVEWRKEPLESWRATVENQMPKVMVATGANYALPTISDSPAVSGCTNDTWTATSTITVPPRRDGHTAVWTGAEMIVWGGGSDNAGWRYNPGTDTWLPTSTTNAPSTRYNHTAVWTGTEMIVWGGGGQNEPLNTGGRYSPGTDTWAPTSTTNAPSARAYHTAVWTGTEMIVWGGTQCTSCYLNTGGRYNPNTDTWIPTGTTNAPTGRASHTAVWTGTEMIVWGGAYSNGFQTFFLNTGGRYNPISDGWTATSTINVPDARAGHTVVWTGSEMIVWGGTVGSTGGRYNPSADTWTATSTTNAPAASYRHSVIWTGSEMIVWGGALGFGDSDAGGRYNPGTDSWIATSTTNAPLGRIAHTAVWTGSEMIVWGGLDTNDALNTGGRYNPSTDSWIATSAITALTARSNHTTVWTGSEMIVWGGSNGSSSFSNGGRYNPSTDSWTATSTINVPSRQYFRTAVWTGSEMIVWGGTDGNYDTNTGGRYNPGADSWTATSITNAPSPRHFHTAVWTGSEMIVWGGSSLDSTGGRYNPGTDSWTATSITNAPSARIYHTAVWTGSEMIVWGGSYLNTGGRYNPGTDIWTPTSTATAPLGRYGHTAVWTGGEMIVWGGDDSTFHVTNTGGRYNPGTDNWTATSTINVPSSRYLHTAVWTGTEMIVWGGDDTSGLSNTGGRYNPGTDTWTGTSTTNAPSGRDGHTAVWTGSEMIVWGGSDAVNSVTNTGGRYCAGSPLMAQSAFSRKTHGGAGTFDVPLPLSGNVGVECRSGGTTNDYQMIINFMTSVTVESASVTFGTGSVSNFSVSGSQVTVNLTGVTNVQRITVTLFNVNDGTHMGNVPVSMGVLVGDVNGNALVNASDVALTKSQVGNAVSGSNFREDVNANGTISATDVALVKSKVGTSLPP